MKTRPGVLSSDHSVRDRTEERVEGTVSKVWEGEGSIVMTDERLTFERDSPGPSCGHAES